MKRTLVRAALYLALSVAATSQNSVGTIGRPSDPTSASSQPIHQRMFLDYHPTDPILSFEQLVDTAEVIVDAVVLSSNTRKPTGSLQWMIVTDSIISVIKVLKGEVATSTLEITQEGGSLEGREVVNTYSAIVKSGDQYIFFLNRPRISVNTRGDEPLRFRIAGGPAGLAKVNGNQIQFGAKVEERISKLNSESLSDFFVRIEDRVAGKMPAGLTPPDLPVPRAAAEKVRHLQPKGEGNKRNQQ